MGLTHPPRGSVLWGLLRRWELSGEVDQVCDQLVNAKEA